MEKLFGHAGTSLVRTSVTTGEHLRRITAAIQAEVEVKVERRSDVLIVASTFSALADVFSILLQRRRGFRGSKRFEQHLVGDLGETRAVHAIIGEHLLQVGN